MPDVVVVFGTEMNPAEAELTRSVMELVRRGQIGLARTAITKMGECGYNHELAVLARELSRRGSVG